MPDPIDLTTLRRDLYNDANNHTLFICEDTETDILTDDLELHRYINYHLTPPTREWIQSLFYFPSNCKKDQAVFLNRCLDLLSAADPNMLITLRHIFFIRTAADIQEICSLPGISGNTFSYTFPRVLMDQGNGASPSLECMGCFWCYESAIVINMRAIESVSDSLDPDDNSLIPENTFVTLAHELRHLGLENPYLSEKEYPPCLQLEEKVEAWGREVYEKTI